MNILDDLDFIENNWDVCCNDPKVSEALQSSDSLSECESFYSSEIEKDEDRFLLEFNQNLKIDDIYDNVLSAITLIEKCNDDFLNSLGELHYLEQYIDSNISTNVAKDVYDFFYIYLPIISKIKYLQKIKKNEIYMVHEFFKKYPKLRDIYPTLISAFEMYSKAKVRSWRKFIIDNIYFTDHSTKCVKYYEYYGKMVDFNEEKMKKLQEDCIIKIVSNVMRTLTDFPFHDFKDKVKRDEAIQQLLKLELYTPNNLPNFPENPKSEFRIIKFIIILPEIIKKQISKLHSIFPDERVPFVEILTRELRKEYRNYLGRLQFRRDTIYETAMTWCLIFRIAAFHDLTVILESQPYKSCVEEMIDDTIKISNDKANEIYLICTKPNAPLFKEYDSLVSKLDLKNLTDPKLQLYYINKTILIIKRNVFPVIRRITMYYHELLTDRSNFDKLWYNGIIDTIKKYNNMWMLNYLMKFQESPLMSDFIYSNFTNFEEKYVLKLFCYMTYYIGYHPDLYRSKIVSFFFQYVKAAIKRYPRFQDDDMEKILSFKVPSADFINANYQNYINEVVQFTTSKLELAMQSDEQQGIIETLFGKVQNIDWIEAEDKQNAIKKFIEPFIGHFSYSIDCAIKKFSKNKSVVLPSTQLLKDAIRGILLKKNIQK